MYMVIKYINIRLIRDYWCLHVTSFLMFANTSLPVMSQCHDGFHEIRRISGEIRWISWNPWNPADFMKSVKSGRFHEIREIWQISGEIQWISPRYHLWNPPKFIKASVSAKTLQFDECRVGDFTLEIHQISPWNLVDFTCEIWWISPRFHLWNPPKVIKASVSAKTLQFDECRVGAMTKDFMKSTRFHPWNLADFTQISPVKSTQIIKASVSAKTLQFDECRVGDFTLKSGGFHPWNLADFTQIWPVKSTQNYKSKCFSKNSSVWWMQGGGFHPWNPVDFTLKSGGFHPISPVKSSRVHPDFIYEIHPKL